MRHVIVGVALAAGMGASVLGADGKPQPVGSHGVGTQGAVSGGGAGAVAAGIEILQADGVAADAAAATILALSVTDNTGFCFGGEVPILVYDAKTQGVEAIAGQGAAPKLATREHFAKSGGIPISGVTAAAVPGAFDAVLTLLDRHGTKRFEDVAAPTLRLLDQGGQPWHPLLAKTIRRLIDAERAAPGDRRRGLRLTGDCFYRGPIARELAAWSQANGGLIRYEDLACHVTRVEEPLSVDYRGHRVYKCGYWTQGACLLQSLQLLEGFDLKAMGHNRPDAIHTTAEALKLALADRDDYYGDPLRADVPERELLDPAYAAKRRQLINSRKASLERRPGDPRTGAALATAGKLDGRNGPKRDTTTAIAADRWGNVVVATPSGWSGVQAGETGVWLGSRLQSFNIQAGHPNCIEPGKRPRITLTPTLVLKDNKPALAVSVAGGDQQDQTALQIVLNEIDFGLSPVDSMAASRFGTNHHVGSFAQTPPELGSLTIPDGDDATIDALSKLGHKVKRTTGSLAAPSAIKFHADGRMEAAGDPRAGRHAAAY